jgi:Region found in RelA / SpoT proteins
VRRQIPVAHATPRPPRRGGLFSWGISGFGGAFIERHVHDRRLRYHTIWPSHPRQPGCPLALDEIRDHIQDIAGIRITCSFISDTYRVSDMLTCQQDVTVLKVKDYIA